MSSYQESDSKIANFALQRLRSASEKIPSAKEKESMGHILKQVKSANEEISKCEKSFQEQAEVLNKTIAHSISSYVDKELLSMERGLRESLQCNPMDEASVEKVHQSLVAMKEKLLYLFDMVSRWGWSHLRQVQKERVAEMYEKINDQAEKTGKVFEQFAVHCPDQEKKRLLAFQAKFIQVIQQGSDQIDPDEIFSGG